MARTRGEPRTLDELRRRRATLLKQLGRLDAELAALEAEARRSREASASPRRGGRPVLEQTLADVLAAVLRGGPMRIKEAAEAAQRAGYRSGSPHFRQMVANALADKERFRRVGRGRYRAR